MMIKIKFVDTSDSYYDDECNGFSLLSRNNIECFSPDPCKENFTEYYWDHVNKAHAKKKVILFKHPDITKKWATRAQNLLNVIEKELKTPLSKVTYHYKTNGPSSYGETHRLIIDVSSPLWFKNGPMIHLFCLLVRNAHEISYNRKKWETILTTLQNVHIDGSQFRTSRRAIGSLIKNKGELILYKQTHLGICDYANENFM
jgi:hypothetical protein